MFFSPNVRIFNSENSNNAIQRKQATTNAISRKPFLDRAVNFNTPNQTSKKPLQEKPTDLFQEKLVQHPLISSSKTKQDTECLDTKEFLITNKDTIDDTFTDLQPCFTKQHALRFLKNSYKEVLTPPPSPENFDFVVKERKIDLSELENELKGFQYELPDYDIKIPDNFDIDLPTLSDLED